MQHNKSNPEREPPRWLGSGGALMKAESAITLPNNPWEMQTAYNMKTDIWQARIFGWIYSGHFYIPMVSL